MSKLADTEIFKTWWEDIVHKCINVAGMQPDVPQSNDINIPALC